MVRISRSMREIRSALSSPVPSTHDMVDGASRGPSGPLFHDYFR